VVLVRVDTLKLSREVGEKRGGGQEENKTHLLLRCTNTQRWREEILMNK
jgi:hypothetical protein